MRAVEVGEYRSVASGSSEELDLRSLGRGLWRRRMQVIIPTILVAIAAFLIVQGLTPKYRSEARVLLEGRDNVFLRAEAEKTVDRNVVDPEAVASQVQLIQSRDIARKVITELKLGDRAEFDSVRNGVSVSKVFLSLFGLARDPLSAEPQQRVFDAYYDRLRVFSVDRSRVIAISFDANDPELASLVANTVADTYLEFQKQAKQDQARSAGTYLASEITELRKKVADAESKVEGFRTRSDLYSGANNTSLSNQQLTELNSQLATARGQKAEADSKARAIREMLNTGKPLEASDVLKTDIIRRLTEQLATVRAQLAEQSATLLERHPRIKELRAQIGDLDRQLKLETEKLARALENDAKVATAKVDQLSVTLKSAKQNIAQGGEGEVELRALEREAKAQRDLLESYLAKYREAVSRDSLDAAPAEARIISKASPSNIPVFPKKLPIIVVATLGALILSLGFAVTAELLGGGETLVVAAPRAPSRSLFSSFRNIGRRREPIVTPEVTVPPAFVAPAAATGSLRAVPFDDIVKSFRGAGERARKITFVGAMRNAGTTHAAIALGRALSNDARVVLVDLAVNSPNISIVSTDPGAPGIADLARGTASIGQVITRDKFSRLQLIALGQTGGNPSAILSSPQLAQTLDALANAYDHVIVDAGSLTEFSVQRMSHVASRAVLVTSDLSNSASAAAREQLIAAGFADVVVLQGRPRDSMAAA